jgi:streptogramin lyase
MKRLQMKGTRAVAVAVAAVGLVAYPTTAGADADSGTGQVTPVAQGLEGPRQIDHFRGNSFLVAESDSGEISSVDSVTGAVQTLLTFGTPESPSVPQGVDWTYERQLMAVALGETGGGPEAPPTQVELPPPGTPVPTCTPTTELPTAAAVALIDGRTLTARMSCDLLAYELVVNPDRQNPADEQGVAVDALSNPFGVLIQEQRVLVADAGANAILSIDQRDGRIKTFFVPPNVTDGPCAGEPNNPAGNGYPAAVGCDSVPTAVVQGPRGTIYVTTLGGLAPGAGRVYVLDSGGRLLRTITGLNAPTGIAVADDGTVYVSELFGETSAGEPDPSGPPPGRVVRIAPDGTRSFSAVVLPQGLELYQGKLYGAALSLAPGAGQLVRIGSGSFGPPA